MNTSKLFIKKLIIHIEYKYEGCEHYKFTSTYFHFVSLLYLFILKKVLESNNEQVANTKSSFTVRQTTFLMLFLMRYQAQNLGKKLCSLGKVRVYQCFFFQSLGLVLKLEWVRMQWKLQKFVYSYEYFKTVRSKTYYALNTSTRAVNNSSALLLIFVLCPCFICSS